MPSAIVFPPARARGPERRRGLAPGRPPPGVAVPGYSAGRLHCPPPEGGRRGWRRASASISATRSPARTLTPARQQPSPAPRAGWSVSAAPCPHALISPGRTTPPRHRARPRPTAPPRSAKSDADAADHASPDLPGRAATRAMPARHARSSPPIRPSGRNWSRSGSAPRSSFPNVRSLSRPAPGLRWARTTCGAGRRLELDALGRILTKLDQALADGAAPKAVRGAGVAARIDATINTEGSR